MKTFNTTIKIKFREADPAKIMFFGNILDITHDVFEEFIQAAGFTWEAWFLQKDWLIPIRHTETNFLRPFLPGHNYNVNVRVDSISNSSFKLCYVYSSNEGLHAEVSMVHTFLSSQSKEKIKVPDTVKEYLTAYTKKID